MTLPLGVQSTIFHVVCKLNKSLYGLKQTSRQWYAKLNKVVLHSENDYSLFCKRYAQSIIFLAVYVDDILLTGNDEEEILSLKTFPHFFLGIEILQTDEGLLLTQRKFAVDLLTEFNWLQQSVVVCPLDYGVNFIQMRAVFSKILSYIAGWLVSLTS